MAELTTFYKNGVSYLFRSQYTCLSSILKTCIATFAEKAYEAGLITEPVKGAAVRCSYDQLQYSKCFSDINEEFTTGLELKNTIEEIQEYCQKFVEVLKDLGGPPEVFRKKLEEKLLTLFDLTYFLICDAGSATSTVMSQYGCLHYEELDKECDDSVMIEVSQKCSDYIKVGQSLNLSKDTLDNITENEHNDEARKTAVLYAWKKLKGSTGTFIELINAFLKMKDRIVTESILRYLSRKTKSEPLTRRLHLAPEKAKDHYPNWDKLTESEKEAVRNQLIDDNHCVRKAYATFVVQLIQSFITRQVEPRLVKPLIRSYGTSDGNQHPPDFDKGDSIADVLDELSKHCTWFNYESFKVVVDILGNEDEKTYLKTYEEDNLIPYLKRSIFEIPCDVHSQSQHTNLLFQVPTDLCITGNQVKTVQRNLAKLLGLENGAILHFEDYNIGSIELIFSLPTVILSEISSKPQLFAFFEWNKSKNCYEVNADLFTVLSFCENPKLSSLIKLLNKKEVTLNQVLALSCISENDILDKEAEKILDPVSLLLYRHYERLSQLILSMEATQMLYTEKIISKATFHEMETLGGSLADTPLMALHTTMSRDPSQFTMFANVLLHSKKTVLIAQDVLNDIADYLSDQKCLFSSQHKQDGKKMSSFDESELIDSSNYNSQISHLLSCTFLFLQLEDIIVKTEGDERSLQAAVMASHIEDVQSLRQKFKALIPAITSLVPDNFLSLQDLKNYLQRSYRELKPQLAHAKTFDDVITIIVEQYNIINIDCLEAVVDHLKITEAKSHISAYKKTVTMFCEDVRLDMCYNESFKTVSSSCLLTCETIQLTLEWKAHKHKLKDIQELLTKLFEDNHSRVYITDIREDNFIIVTCYTPQHMVSVLLMEVNENSHVVEELIRLTIGYYTVCHKIKRNEKESKGQQTIDLISKVENKKSEKDREDMLGSSHEELKAQLEPYKKKCSAMTREIEELRTSLSQKKESEQLEQVITKLSLEKQQLEEEKERHQMEKKILNTKLLEINSLREEKKLLEDKLKMEQLKVKQMEQKMDMIMGSRVPLLYEGWKAELQSPPVQTVMSNFNYYKKSEEEWYSPSFLSYLNGYEMCVRITANGEDEGQGTHLSLYIHLMAGKNDDNLSWPFRGEVKVQLINRREDHDHYEQNIVFDDSSNVQACSRVINGIPIKAGLANRVGEGTALFIGHDILTSTLDFLVEDSISIRIKEVIVHSSPTIVPSTPSDPLPVIPDFKIDNFSKRQQSNEECISDPFYSHENGYKLSLLVYPNGRDKWKNKYISMFVHLMKGENDNNLTFPFRGKILVQIVNLKENKNHAERLVEFNEKTDPKGEYGARLTGLTGLLSGRQYRGYGYPNFLSHKFLEFDKSRNTQYVSDDDSLHIRILKI